MAASVRVNEYNGSGETETTGISNLNFGDADQANLNPATYPIERGTCSFDKWVKWDFYGGTFNRVSNFKFWRSDGSGGDGPALPTGIAIQGETGVGSDLTYSEPAKTDISKDPIPNELGNALDVGPTELTEYGKTYYVHLQLKSTVDSATGDIPTLYFTLQWQEE